MYCKKCGNLMPDGSKFCEKCGTKVDVGQTPQQSAQSPQPNQTQQAFTQMTPPTPAAPTAQNTKSTSANRLTGIGCSVIGAIIGIVVCVGAFIHAVGGSFGIDYIGSVKAMQPLRPQSDATYAELVDGYFENAKWKERKGDNGIVYVDISGPSKDGDEEIKLTIRVEPTDDPEIFTYTPHRIMIDGAGQEGEEYASNFVYDLYLYYAYGPEAVYWYDFFDAFAYLFS